MKRQGFYSEELIVPRPTAMLENYLMSDIRNYLFNVCGSTHRIWMPWWLMMMTIIISRKYLLFLFYYY
jgi:hypothetical protein